jgi:hypothetical protein
LKFSAVRVKKRRCNAAPFSHKSVALTLEKVRLACLSFVRRLAFYRLARVLL